MNSVLFSTMTKKVQFKMYLPEELAEKLKLTAEKTGRSSGQDVAEQVITYYLNVWSVLEVAIQAATKEQVKDRMPEKPQEIPEIGGVDSDGNLNLYPNQKREQDHEQTSTQNGTIPAKQRKIK